MSPFATEHRPSRLRWAAVAALLCALVAAVAVAAWPVSAADTAYDDGKRVGVALADLRDAETYDDVDESLTEVRAAAADARDHAGDELSEQMTERGDALSRALNGFDGAVSADSEWDQELYELELDVALTDLSDQAEEFRAEAPEVEQAFYDGLQEGLQA